MTNNGGQNYNGAFEKLINYKFITKKTNKETGKVEFYTTTLIDNNFTRLPKNSELPENCKGIIPMVERVHYYMEAMNSAKNDNQRNKCAIKAEENAKHYLSMTGISEEKSNTLALLAIFAPIKRASKGIIKSRYTTKSTFVKRVLCLTHHYKKNGIWYCHEEIDNLRLRPQNNETKIEETKPTSPLPESDPAHSISTTTIAKKGAYYIANADFNHNGCHNKLWTVKTFDAEAVNIKCMSCGESIAVSNKYLQKNFTKYECNTEKGFAKIGTADAIVLSGVRRCTSRGHNITDTIALISLKSRGKVITDTVPVSYCKECNRYTMLDNDYKNLRGTPVCTVTDQRTNQRVTGSTNNEFQFEANESIMHEHGYNVRAGNGLSSSERCSILVKLINNNIMTRSQICEHLEYCIWRNRHRDNMKLAISKWQADLKYILSYNPDKVSDINIRSITLK